MSVLARWRAGETIELSGYDGREFQLRSERALAPGQPLSLQVDVGIGFSLDLKSIGSVKRPDGSFSVRARATTLSKHARESLAKLFQLSEPR